MIIILLSFSLFYQFRKNMKMNDLEEIQFAYYIDDTKVNMFQKR